MNKIESMEWAADYAERNGIFAVPTNRNGYPQDGHKQLTPSERADVIIKIAATVVDPEDAVAKSLDWDLLQRWHDQLFEANKGSGNWLAVRGVIADMELTLG